MHNTYMCSFQGSRLFIPVNTTNFIPHHKPSCAYHIALHDEIELVGDRPPSAVSSSLFMAHHVQPANCHERSVELPHTCTLCGPSFKHPQGQTRTGPRPLFPGGDDVQDKQKRSPSDLDPKQGLGRRPLCKPNFSILLHSRRGEGEGGHGRAEAR